MTRSLFRKRRPIIWIEVEDIKFTLFLLAIFFLYALTWM